MKNYLILTCLFAVAGLLAACDKEDTPAEAPLAADAVEVRGTLIDIRTLESGEQVFPQHDQYVFGADADLLFDETMRYAVGLKESRGVEAFRCGSDATVYLATDCTGMRAEGWKAADRIFTVNDLTYYIYCYESRTPGKWIAVPDPADRKCSTMLFAKTLSVSETTVPGTVIAQVPQLRSGAINNVSMTILPDGDYIASCTGATGPGAKGVSLFLSQDKGRTWSVLSQDNIGVNGIANYNNLFVHDGNLYMMGTGVGGRDVLITRSADKGRTWTYPADGRTGVLLSGAYHSSSVPVVVCNGRIWRAMEEVVDTKKEAFVLSAPADADLLNAANWTRTATIPLNTAWEAEGSSITELIEGNMVATPDGKLYNILRASSSGTSLAAAKVTVLSEHELRFTAPGDFIHFPGGGKKFTIRYDAESRRYWTLTNPAHAGGMKHDGIYFNGITRDLIRNRLVLCYSTDLNTWVQYKEVLSDDDPFFHGFQYTDWMFDGQDLVAVCRMACPESRGLPVRQHDANFMTFLRIRNFRNL